MNHIHLVNNDKFVEPLIKFINANFKSNEHKFIYFTSQAASHIKDSYINLFKHEKILWNVRLLKELHLADRIYLHSLFDIRVVVLLFFQPKLLKKCYWIVWGGDLYSYRKPRSTLKMTLKEMLRAFVIKRFGHIVTLVRGDYDLAKEWYRIKGKYHHGAYVNPISKKYLDSLPSIKKQENDPIVIQIGNSADSTNNHIDALNSLKKFKEKNIKIFAPLSYGNKEYAQLVIVEGKKLFGDKFIPLTEFLTPDKYSAYLNNIDIAIFNNDRQQALGNIYALLYLNKKVYIRSDTSMWIHFKEKFNIDMNNLILVENLNFEQFVQKSEAQNNIKINNVFEEKYLVNIWRNIFD